MRGLGLLVALGLFASTAWAESPTHQLARKHFELGNSYYQVSNYKAALDEFEKAYALEPLPGLIFNIARCHEVLGNLKDAIAKYKLFLAKSPADASDRGTVELRIRNLEARLKEQAPPPVRQPDPPAAPPASPPVDEPRPTRSWRWPAGWAALGVGAAALAAGIASGAMVASKSDEFERAAAEGKTYQTLLDLRAAGERYQKVEVAMLVVGGVALAAGGGLLIWELAGRRRPPSTALLPLGGPGGFGLALSSQF